MLHFNRSRLSSSLTFVVTAVLSSYLVGCSGSDNVSYRPGTTAGTGGSASSTATPAASKNLLFALVSPDGTSDTEAITAYEVAGDGSVAPLPTSPVTTNGEGNRGSKSSGVVTTPDRRFMVVAHNTSQQLESFRIEADGSLTSAGTVTLTADPADLAMHPLGTVVYASLGQSGAVAAVEIDATTGALAELASSPVNVGSSVRDLDVHPSGLFLATGHMFGTDMGVKLHPLYLGHIGAPALQSLTLTGASRPGASVSYARSGELLMVRDLDQGVYSLSVDLLNGQLTEVAGSPFGVGGFSSDMAVHPSGNHVYVVRPFRGSEITGFDIDSQGSLSVTNGFPVTLVPQGQTGSASFQHMSLSKSGNRLYLTARDTAELIGFQVIPQNGFIAPLWSFSQNPVTVPASASAVAPGPVVCLD